MLKALVSNNEKLQELANSPLNENCSKVILKKLPKKHGDPGKFLIPCGFSELKCKALADLGASINLMPLFVWKKLGLPEVISTRMTLELANRAICTPTRIVRDVFVLFGKFTFPANFVSVDYKSDPRVPFILRRPFLWTARALIDVHGKEMILRDGDERLTLNRRLDTSRCSNQPQKESINLINVFNNSSEYFLEDLFANQPPRNVPLEKLLDLDSTKDLHPPFYVNPLSGSTTYSSNQLLEEFTDELALITFPPKYDDDLQFDIDEYFLEDLFANQPPSGNPTFSSHAELTSPEVNDDIFDSNGGNVPPEKLQDLDSTKDLHPPFYDIDSSLKDLIDQSNLANLADNFIDYVPEMFTDEHALDYSSLLIFDEYDDDFLEVESDTKNVYDAMFLRT
nr:reverse transcriptase domain-containing protein [Tanacetum cinerariifolium]